MAINLIYSRPQTGIIFHPQKPIHFALIWLLRDCLDAPANGQEPTPNNISVCPTHPRRQKMCLHPQNPRLAERMEFHAS